MHKTTAVLLVFVMAASGVAALFPAKAEPKTITVPDDYPTIQAAINNASAGDTVFVKNGIYYTPFGIGIDVDKPLSLIGENSKETVIVGVPSRYGENKVIQIDADNVVISGFTIRDDWIGIDIGSSRCKLAGNNIVNNTNTGIIMERESNVISGNNITESGWYGIYITSSNSLVSENNITGSGSAGIIVDNCKNATITGNSITGNGVDENGPIEDRGGIFLRWAGPFYVYGNNVTDNRGYAIQFGEGCANTIVHNNNVARNSIGINLLNFPIEGDAIIGTGNVAYYNNLVDNSQNAHVEHAYYYNISDIRNGTDIVSWDNGFVGNYWSDYNSQGAYVIDENNIDHHPLTQQVDISTTAPAGSTNLLTITIIVVAVVGVVAVVAVGILVYFKKRKH